MDEVDAKRERSLIHALVGDVELALQRCQSEDSESNRRAAIRTIFAGIEGALWIAKSSAVGLAPALARLTVHEIACLREEGYSVTAAGKVKSQPKFTPVHTSVKLLIAIMRRIKADYELDLNHPAWAYLHNSTAVRNRLTHPKSRDDLVVSSEEVAEAWGAFNWMLALTIDALSILTQTGEERFKSWMAVTAESTH